MIFTSPVFHKITIIIVSIQGRLKGGQSRLLTSMYIVLDHTPTIPISTNTNPSCLRPFWCLSGSANPTSSQNVFCSLLFSINYSWAFIAINISWLIGCMYNMTDGKFCLIFVRRNFSFKQCTKKLQTYQQPLIDLIDTYIQLHYFGFY